MNDNLRRHRAIKEHLLQLCPNATSRQRQYLSVLAGIISGMVGSRHSNLPAIAAKVPSTKGIKRESQIKTFYRWLKADTNDYHMVFAPFAQALLKALAASPLVLVIDGSSVGQGGMALLINVVYKGRALPIGWLVIRSKKGHLAEKYHIALLKQVKSLVPDGSQVIFVGDGEFDGCRLLRRLDHYGWQYVCRTAKSSLVWLGDERTSFGKLAVEPNTMVCLAETIFSKYEYGPLQAVAVWQAEYKEPLYLVTNLTLAEEALWYYRKRFRIETFFSDSKSRGFRLDKSHLKEPRRLERLVLAACLAYLWIVYLGTVALIEGWHKVIHRTERVDLSLFNLGLNLLEHFLNETMPLPVSFIPLEHEELICVR
ncbi:MAG TPA: IS4 family transposase [Chloroflexia bacterium]|nr:IS4 family transposase [Chloroflexia bacterium]